MASSTLVFLSGRYREGNRLEFKDARGGLPRSFWETYSAFANTNGGVVVLGVMEAADGSPHPSGIANPDTLVQDLWNTLNNPLRVSANLLLDGDVTIEEFDGSPIVVVRVPRADRTLRPVYINNNPNTGTFRRNGEGDYRCTPETVRSLMRDSAEGPVGAARVRAGCVLHGYRAAVPERIACGTPRPSVARP